MNNDRFTGYFVNASEPFHLTKLYDYYHWDYYYDWNYHYWYYDNWSWDFFLTKTRGTNTDEVPAAFNPDEVHIVKIGNRFNEKD